MDYAATSSAPADAQAETAGGPDLRALQAEWKLKIEDARKARQKFDDEAKRAIKWLRLNKEGRAQSVGGGRLNIAWSNYEILRSATYSRPPKIVVIPRFGGGPNRQKLDAVAQVIERAVESNNQRVDIHSTLKMVRDDLLKVGQGVPWVRYDSPMEEQELPAIDEAGEPILDEAGEPTTAMQPVKSKGEKCFADYVSWRDYLEGTAEVWSKVPWVAKRVAMNRKAFKKRFKDVASTKGVVFGEAAATNDRPKTTEGQTADIWEIWCKESGKVYFFHENALEMIEVEEPLINVDGFFPCPEPAASCYQDGTRQPIPDVLMIEDLLNQVDRLTKRIDALQEALKVRGFYAKGATSTTSADAIERAVRQTDDRQLIIPVEAWAANGQGKLEIVWLPIDVVSSVIAECITIRRETMGLIDQILGISDIMRGESQATETLGAQQLKAQYGSVRIRDKQDEMKRVARDLCRMIAEVICEVFDPESIADMAVYGMEAPEQPGAEAAEVAMKPGMPQGDATPVNMEMVQLMRDDKMRSLVLDIETDSTIQADEDAEKQRRVEFATAMGSMMQQALPVIQAAPELLAPVGELMKFVAGAFRTGRELEKSIDDGIRALTQRVSQPPPPPPPPVADPNEQIKAEAVKARASADVARANIDLHKTAMEAQAMGIPMAPPQAPPVEAQPAQPKRVQLRVIRGADGRIAGADVVEAAQ